MEQSRINAILDAHYKWLRGVGGGARASFIDADLRGADLENAYLMRAFLVGADLRDAKLGNANLKDADLMGANLSGTDLWSTCFARADLRSADLTRADIRSADLRDANLTGARLGGARLPDFQLPGGDIVAYKKCREGIVRLLIPAAARRTATLVGRKCRAEYAIVTVTPGGEPAHSRLMPEFAYIVGSTVRPTEPYDPDIRVACASGIHFFATHEEAEAYNG